MPYKSDKQRRFMHAQHPDIAARWDAEIRRERPKPSRTHRIGGMHRVGKHLDPIARRRGP